MSEHLSIVHEAAWRAVVGRVDAAVAAGKISAAERDLLVRPVQLLQFMADETPAALGDDVLAQERLRALLYLSAPWAALVDETQRILKAFERRKMPPLSYAAGVLHHGALVLVGVAAVRVAVADPLVKLFARTVQGVALLCAGAETLGRLEPRGPTGDTLAAMVKELVERDGGQAGDASVLRPVQSDPVERGRWVTLHDLMKHVIDLAGDKAGAWDGGFSMVSEVTPNVAIAGETIELGLTAPIAEAGLEIPASLHVVFAAPGARPIEPITRPKFVGDKLVVQVPAGAAPGWIGFSDDKRVARSHEFRLHLREQLKEFGVLARLDDAPIPVELIDPYASPPGTPTPLFLAAPPRTAGNRFYGGTPEISAAELTPSSVETGGALMLRWESQAATEVEKQPGGEKLPASGTLALTAPMHDGDVRITLTPVLRRGDQVLRGKALELNAIAGTRAAIAEVVIRQNGHEEPYFFGAPLDVEVLLLPETARAQGVLIVDGISIESSADDPPGKVTFSIPADQLRDVTRFTIALAGGEVTAARRRDMKVRIDPGQSVTLVAFRPTVLGDEGAGETVSDEELEEALGVARGAGFTVRVVEVPFVPDALAVLPRPLASGDDPQIPALFEALSGAAMRSQGFENALWAAVVRRPFGAPEEPPILLASVRLAAALPRSFAALPAEGAQAVGVASLNGLSDLMAAAFPRPSAAQARDRIVTDRLRLLGHLLPGDRVVMDTPRQERRASGPGSPADTRLVAFALDCKGRELSRTPLRAVSPDRPTLVTELLPVTPEMASVELRLDDGTKVYTFVRSNGRPKLTDVSLHEGELKWTYSHPDGAVPCLTVELVKRLGDGGNEGEIPVPFFTADACGNTATLPLRRVRSADAVRLVASDGWNVASVDVEGSEIENEQPIVLRQLGSGGFWADATGAEIEAWQVNGREQVGEDGKVIRTPVVHLPPDLHGIIALNAGAGTDRRALEDDDA
ncbi:MAG: hypothetical protein ACM3PC_06730 [Deltaproteobacteria bacterium]